VGAELPTVEGLTASAGAAAGGAAAAPPLHPLQEAFRAEHALQCGFCTAGILLSLIAFLREHPHPDEREIREALSGHLCRCTGYQNIVRAVQRVAAAETTPR
jgi:aerobic-type carbon monoxide dehydrogenase small subunit (CoxS/CutS family)